MAIWHPRLRKGGNPHKLPGIHRAGDIESEHGSNGNEKVTVFIPLIEFAQPEVHHKEHKQLNKKSILRLMEAWPEVVTEAWWSL